MTITGYASSLPLSIKKAGVFATQAFKIKRASGCTFVFSIKPPKALKNYILYSDWLAGFKIYATTSTRD